MSTRQLVQVFEPGLPPVLDRIDLDIAPGEFVCLLGASGCGKSTLVNLMAGLLTPSSGTIELTSERPALMFQEPALLPWLTATANVELALRARGVARDERRKEAARLLEVVNLGGKQPNGSMSSLVACVSGSPWPGRWPRTVRFC